MRKGLPKKVLILGSGALKIGEAGEFDYSGSQALKALSEEGIRTVLVNPNIATIQTSKGMADQIYFLPVNAEFVEKVIERERPNGILLGFGGQTALNCGLELARHGVLEKYGVRVLGTSVKTIKITEDRALFRQTLERIGLDTPLSQPTKTLTDAMKAADDIGYPVIIRGGYSLGGRGSAVAHGSAELQEAARKALSAVPQILVEEYLEGWKEVEYEVVRDAADNCLTVCNMENVDPMGIHTGESIVVAPSQTLTNHEYHKLRAIAIKLIRALKVVGECNVQFALDPRSDVYRIIEVNARLSRSSALASKATGYPLAYVAAKLALGYTLPELKNSVTKVTTVCFEPALDYITVKIPRWDLKKFTNVSKRIGSEMKSVGEVMAIGRTFEEALQKAIRMLDIGADGLVANTNFAFSNLLQELRAPTDERLFAIAEALRQRWTVRRVAEFTHIDPWFLYKMKRIVDLERLVRELPQGQSFSEGLSLRTIKQAGFSDLQIARLTGRSEQEIRELRIKIGCVPQVNQIDTLAAEYPAKTNYLYMTYHGVVISPPARGGARGGRRKYAKKKILILGSGAYKIGSSVEFDWCAVNTVRTLKRLGYETIVVNCNPETVSTDYDECDRLYFEELTLERILDICAAERPYGVIVSVGGQIPNTLALSLSQAGIKILGTPARAIHQAEDRHVFSTLLKRLQIAQPHWKEVTNFNAIKNFADKVGYPVLVRPSYVLSGAAMAVAFTDEQLMKILEQVRGTINNEHPVVVSKFISGAKELEIDAVAQKGKLVVWALSEHIENAGVHSGDATIVLPARKIYRETEDKIVEITRRIAKALNITGPFNVQFLAKSNLVMVIECNLRASRSFPFVSKVLNVNFIELAIRVIIGEKFKPIILKKFDYVGVKAPQFSFSRLHGADPVLAVEMRSTGEVASLGTSVEEALLKSLIATGFEMPKRSILLSLGGDQNKIELLSYIQKLIAMGYGLYATPRTAEFLKRYDVQTSVLTKPSSGDGNSVLQMLRSRHIDLFINTSDEAFPEHIPDDYRMRRTAVDFNIPLITNIQLAKIVINSLNSFKNGTITLDIKAWDEYVVHP